MKKIENSECLCSFGEYIREARELKGLTQSEMAATLGMAQSYYSYVEQGKRNVDLVLALKICQELKINMRDFVKNYL